MTVLPRTTARALLCAASGAVSLLSLQVAHAATITVNTTSMTEANDTQCTFGEAVKAVNNQAAFKGCSAGNGSNDTINLPSGTLSTAVTVAIGRSVVINGQGVGTTTFQSTSNHALFIESQTGNAARVTIKNMTIRGNTQSQQVTGLFVSGTGTLVDGLSLEVFLERVRVADFTNTGIFAQNEAWVQIRSSTIENNANSGIAIVESGLLMWESLVSNNTRTTSLGGGIDYAGSGNSNIYNSTITNNSARRGGGLHVGSVNGGYLNIHNTTVSHNSATEQGGGAYDDTTQGTPLRAYDSIIGQNTAPLGPDARGTIELNNTVAGAGTGVGPLLDMGGPTRVRPLLKGSPAVDLFTPPVSNNPDDRRDQRGSPRPYNTNEDCGAYEDGPAEAELLFAAAKTGSVNNVITTSGPLSNNAGMQFAGNASGQFVTYRLGVPQTGNYQLRVQIRKGNNRGIWQLATASSLNGTYTNISTPQDHYRSTATTEEIILGNVNATSAGEKFFRFTSTGKNASSSSFQMVLDYIWLIKL